VDVLIDVYDTATGKFLPPHDALARGRGATSVGNKAMFAGGGENGGSLSNVVHIYDADANQWSTATLSQARSMITANSLNGIALFAGGNMGPNDHLQASDVVDIYSDATGAWSTAHLSSARLRMKAAIIGSKIILAGGGPSDPSSAVDIYDTATGKWSTATLSQAASSGYGLKTIASDNLLFFDEYGTTGDVIDIYDSVSGQWTSKTLNHAAESSFTMATTGHTVAVYGGNSAYLFNTVSRQWTTTRLARIAQQPLATAAGDLLLFSAWNYVSHRHVWYFSRRVDVLNTTTGKWSTTDMPAVGAEELAQTVGAQAIFVDDHNAQIFDSRTGQWSVTPLSQSHFFGSSIVANGQVILAGGFTDVILGYSGFDILRPTDLVPPANPSFKDGATLAASPARFSWTASPGASSYYVYIDEHYVRKVSSNRLALTTALAAGVHTWRVVANFGSGSLGGEAWTFTVAKEKPSALPQGSSGMTTGAGKIRLASSSAKVRGQRVWE
jgi:hypothetical protein